MLLYLYFALDEKVVGGSTTFGLVLADDIISLPATSFFSVEGIRTFWIALCATHCASQRLRRLTHAQNTRHLEGLEDTRNSDASYSQATTAHLRGRLELEVEMT